MKVTGSNHPVRVTLDAIDLSTIARLAGLNIRQIRTPSGDEMSDPLLDAMQLIGAEAERAHKLFPDDEAEAVCELLRRSHKLPELKKGMLVMCAVKVIETARQRESK